MKPKWQKIGDALHAVSWNLEQRPRATDNASDVQKLEEAMNFVEDAGRCLAAFVEVGDWMEEINVKSFDKYHTRLAQDIQKARDILSSNTEEKHD